MARSIGIKARSEPDEPGALGRVRTQCRLLPAGAGLDLLRAAPSPPVTR